MLSDTFNTPLDENLNSLALNGQARADLRTAGKWGRLLAIVAFIFLGLAVLGIIFGASSFLAMGSAFGSGMGAMGGLIMLLYLAILAIAFYIYYLLYQFATNAIIAADSQSGSALNNSLAALAKLFMIAGIFTLIFIVIYALGIAAFLVIGLITGF